MTAEFGNVTDSGEETGTDFGQTQDGDTSLQATDTNGLTAIELDALRKRDESAQALIPTLQSENKDLRDRLVELEDQLASAAKLEDVMAKIANRGTDNESASLDVDTVTQIVNAALQQTETQKKQDSNWNSIEATLIEKYGDWKNADAKVQERAAQLDMPIKDATMLARNNPKVFKELFLAGSTTSAAPSSGVRSGGSGQSAAGNITISGVRDKAYYKALMKTKPAQYWSVETQAQMRRDIPPTTT